MKQRALSWAKFALRWGIALLGIYAIIFGLKIGDRTIIKGMTWRDHALVLDVRNRPVESVVLEADDGHYTILDPFSGQERLVSAAQLVSEPDQKWVNVAGEGGTTRKAELLGLDLTDNINRAPEVERLLIAGPDGAGQWIAPSQAVGYELRVPHPPVEIGLRHMLADANPWLIALGVLIFPATFVITSIRWHALQSALGIEIPFGRTLVLNMVGAFYNTFMPGSTGGDLFKAYEAAKQTHHKTRAVLGVVIDRVIGLITLIVIGGGMAFLRYAATRQTPDPATLACRNVAAACAGMLAVMTVGLVVLFNRTLRRVTGLEFILSRLPMQSLVQKAMETMAILRQRPGLVFWSMIVTVPVHVTVIVSAMLCCIALGVKITPGYYFVVVPVVVLVGSLPVSPQGAGVMEFFAILLLARQGATVGQAFAMTMSIRMVQVLWNMTGGIFVLRGGFHAPTEQEREALEHDDDDADTDDNVSGGPSSPAVSDRPSPATGS